MPTCPRAIAVFVRTQAPELIRIGLETGPLTVWLLGSLQQDGLPAICLDFTKAKMAVARKPAVFLHRIWRDGTEFRWGREAPLTA